MIRYISDLVGLISCEEGTILKIASSSEYDIVAYKCTTLGWAVTGYESIFTTEALHKRWQNWEVIR